MEYKLNTKSITKIIFEEKQIIPQSISEYLDKIRNLNSKIILLTEEKIFKKYQNYIENDLLTLDGLNYHIYFVKEGDFFKNEEIVNKITAYMLEKSFDRYSCILGIGGGKITDLAGYIASIYQRGIDCVLIPSTLLSIIDASIGGKTGINDLKYGKNLIGTVYQPKMYLYYQ